MCPNDAQNDIDADGICGDLDNCPSTSNASQANTDGDALGDACDVCPNDPQNDVDADGICGDLDNCPLISNPSQADLDLDGAGDACDADRDGDGALNLDDCAPDDRDAFATPYPAHTLVVVGNTLTWATPQLPGGPGLRFDLLRSSNPISFANPQCVVRGVIQQSAIDEALPNPGEALAYLVRARNACGENLGTDSAGTPRTAGVCP